MTGRPTPLRVLVVEDDSAQRADLVHALSVGGALSVVGHTDTVDDVVPLVERIHPDVIVLDLHLANGSSGSAIEQIMARRPTPILVLSSRIDDRRSPTAVDALVAGALEALPRPQRWTADLSDNLRRTVRQVSRVVVVRHPRGGLTRAASSRASASTNLRLPVVAVAASTGGPSALATLLGGLGGLAAPVLVVQHLHPDFTAGLVEWMSRVSASPVQLAESGQELRPGRIYIAPGERHLRLGANLRVELAAGPMTIHRPSADQLFRSVADHAGPAGIGVILTGMGDDGARGLLEIRRRGGRTLAQDEASSAVFGMPKAAAQLGAINSVLPLGDLAAAIRHAVREVSRDQ
jgi:two-component system chemotaxis response regulator CheB